MQHHLKNFYTKLVFKKFGKMSQLILQFRVDKNKIKEFVIKEDKLESYNKEIKTLIQQIEKKYIYLSLFQEELTNLIFLLVNQIFINRKLIQNLLSICLKILIII